MGHGTRKTMRVAVLGGGLQGCCTALALAERGSSVVLTDRNDALLSRAAVANEGKIHLGYMYAADPSLSTARMMMEGALAFAPFFQRYVAPPAGAFATSAPASYVVHRDSQHSAEAVSAYLMDVHRLIAESARGRERAYFGLALTAPLRKWSADEREAAFNPEMALEIVDTPEVAINPVALAGAVRAAIAAHPQIEVHLGRQVLGAESDGHGVRVTSDGPDGRAVEPFDHVVNALWDGRLAIDQTMGLRPQRPWLHRLKYGVSFSLPAGLEPLPSATFVSGPFGEVVSYPDRVTYLTWYPECLHGISADITPPEGWATYPPEPLHSRIVKGTIQAMSELMPRLSVLEPASLPDARVKGGVIVAWGKTDIYDPESELHRRYEIGVTSVGRYHSIDPGKLTMAPYFAEKCADRIAGCA